MTLTGLMPMADLVNKWKIIIRDEADRSVYNEIFKIREYRAADEVIKKAEEPILDVGAHSGMFTLYCRALNEKVKIFVLEPEENNFKLLNKHIKENRLKNIKPFKRALAGKTGERDLHISADSHNHSLFHFSGEGKKVVMSDTVSLGDFIKENKIKKISLLKMDIEGGEYEVLESLGKKEFGIINAMIMEYHDLNDRKHRTLETILRENCFGVQIFPSKFDKTMGFIFARNKRG